MPFVADLHLHSPYSRAVSPRATLAGLTAWAQRKGIALLGSGDFTHPAWLQALKEELLPAEPGLYRCRDAPIAPGLNPSSTVRFLLSAEISLIYRHHGRTRKVHHLLYAPDFTTVERINQRLARFGRLSADGRPILGLPSRDLLAIVLDCSASAFLVPAHIWTPWFALFGARSGYDSLEECFGDLAGEIFALETGLSSDPAMNRTISALDRLALISGSDAHSPNRLGREATLFNCHLDYFSLRHALKSNHRDLLAGTIEFFPEEGKYFADGHRPCRFTVPLDAELPPDGCCPVCGHLFTRGVARRVRELADRARPFFPAAAPQVHSLIPLDEILAELLGLGPATKGVQRIYDRCLSRFDSEFALLLAADESAVGDFSPLLGEALRRLRAGLVSRTPGYDGRYGAIHLFAAAELAGWRRTGDPLLAV